MSIKQAYDMPKTFDRTNLFLAFNSEYPPHYLYREKAVENLISLSIQLRFMKNDVSNQRRDL